MANAGVCLVAMKSAKEDLRIYHIQGLRKKELEKLAKAQGRLLIFNNLLPTRRLGTVTESFLMTALEDSSDDGIFFTLTVKTPT